VLDHGVGDLRDAGFQPVCGLGCSRQLGAGDEQLVLHPQDVVVELPVLARGGAADAELGGSLVDRAIGLGARIGFGHAPPVPEAGGAVIALACVDLDRHYSSGLISRPVGIFG
jgi:hypothetical protein